MTIARVPAPNARVAVPLSKADRRHDDGDDRPADQRPQHDPLEPKPERHHAGDGEQCRDPERSAGQIGSARGDETREHDKLALGEIDGVRRLVDQHEPERDQRIHQPDHHAVGQQDQGELPLELRHQRNAALTHPALRTGSPLSRSAGEGDERSETGEGDLQA
jgi:hypothetical protein